MTYQNKATQISLLLHAALVLGGLLLNRCATTETPPLVIDFSIATAEASTGASAQPPGAEQQQLASTPLAQTQPVPPAKETKATSNQPQRKQKKLVTPKLNKTAKEKAKKSVQPLQELSTEPQPLPVVAEHHEESGATLPTGTSQANRTATPGKVNHIGAANPGQAAAAVGGRKEGGTGGGGNNGTPHSSFEYVRRLILNNLRFPATARKMGLTGKMVVSFFLKEDGQVEDIAIVSSSGHEILDNNVVATIRKIAPFPKPPGRAQLVLPIVFNLK